MIVEVETNQGLIVFVKVPDESLFWKNTKYKTNVLWCKNYNNSNVKPIILPYKELNIIGRSDEVDENIAKIMVDKITTGRYQNYLDPNSLTSKYGSGLSSFKSLMASKNIFKINPVHRHDAWYDDQDWINIHKDIYDLAQQTTGNWVVLFKSN